VTDDAVSCELVLQTKLLLKNNKEFHTNPAPTSIFCLVNARRALNRHWTLLIT